jgi:hypothetical protein
MRDKLRNLIASSAPVLAHILPVARANEAGFMKGVGWEKGG